MRRLIPTKLIEWIKSLKNHIAQNGNTTEIGGHLEVDGGINCQPTPISIFGLQEIRDETPIIVYSTPYSKEQILNIAKKNMVNGFYDENTHYIVKPCMIHEDSDYFLTLGVSLYDEDFAPWVNEYLEFYVVDDKIEVAVYKS